MGGLLPILSLPTEVPKLLVSFASMVVGGALRGNGGVRQAHKNRGKAQAKESREKRIGCGGRKLEQRGA